MTLYKDHLLQNPDSISVLMLHPADGDAVIEVSVTTLRLSAKPKFIALSYTWANPIDEGCSLFIDYDLVQYHILCGGERLPVYQNLYEALWQLREMQEYSPLWIDAICIDQENDEELNCQLPLMPYIYCQASCVMIWLGKGDAMTHEGIQTLGSLQHESAFIVHNRTVFQAHTVHDSLHGDVLQIDTTEELKLPFWVPQFHQAGMTSLIDDLLFTQYNAAEHLGPYRKFEHGPSKVLELPVRAVFFGRIVQISSHAAPCHTIPSWFSYVCNSDHYKQQVELSCRGDLAYVLAQELGDRLVHGVGRKAKEQKRRQEYLGHHLSISTLIQLNTQVSRRTMRRLFRFDICERRFIGLAPMTAQESDYLCILQGARIPFIVRETAERGRYRLVGEAFAENFMHGEVKRLEFADREIILV
ncbi:hypothetical protein BBP40_008161 [Aspergillus hancockii]|nr:hypothetical protein BBP40_008161 [Aspergillus hancockii]